jgi:phage terminase large subunit GpA-like protein
MSMIDTYLGGLLASVFRPRSKEGVSVWGRREVKLTAEESPGAPGSYNPDLEPAAELVLDFATDPEYDELVFLKPSRMGFTLAALIAMCWWLSEISGNVIFCIDKAKEVKKLCKTRIIPLMRSIRALAGIMPANDRAMTTETLYLKGKTAYMAGAASVASVTNKGASLVVADELDQYEEFASGEANALEHLRDRVMDVPGAKLIAGGKPRNETDILWPEYQTGTRHRLFVPCPHCKEMQTLEFKGLKFDHCRDEDGGFDLARVARETYYECSNPICRLTEPHFGRIDESRKSWMMSHREWRQTNFGQDDDKPEPRKKSAHVSHLYSQRSKITWSSIALHFLRANKKGGRALTHFWRTRMAEPHREKLSIIKGEMVKLLARDSTYRHGQCPVKPLVVLMCVDVQIDVKKWVKAAFLEDGTCYIIDYGETLTYEELIPILETPVEVLDWGDTPEVERDPPVAEFAWIDEGDGNNSMKDVREFCARMECRGRFFPSKGAGGMQLQKVVDERKRVVGNYQFAAYHFSHDAFAAELYLKRIGKFDEIVAAEKHNSNPRNVRKVPMPAPRLHLMKNPDDQFIDELCAEKRIMKKVKGRLRWVWDDPDGDNDFGDCVKGLLAMWWHYWELTTGNESDGAVEDEHSEEEEEDSEKTKTKGRVYHLQKPSYTQN